MNPRKKNRSKPNQGKKDKNIAKNFELVIHKNFGFPMGDSKPALLTILHQKAERVS